MKYVAFLRGINVGGNNIIKMVDLKTSFEKYGAEKVWTFIQSGNVVFESREKNIKTLTDSLEGFLLKTFKVKIKVVIVSEGDLLESLKNVPQDWNKSNDIRRYVAFVRRPVKAEEVAKELKPRENVDSVKVGDGVVFMTTKLNGLTKSGFNRIIESKFYGDITIRNYTTVKKLLAKMELAT
jgi:uncharacterized protein (DUF1697 family)